MKQLTVFFSTLIFILIFVSGCNKNVLPPPSVEDVFDDQKCYHNGKLTDSERKTIFPFNKAFRIDVISFDSILGKTPIDNDTIRYSKTKETVTLSTTNVNKLTDILYNYNYSKETNSFVIRTAACYYPRHAIVFLNKSNKIITFIEICFECRRVKTSLNKENIGQFCEGKYDLIKEFFISIGIKNYND